MIRKELIALVKQHKETELYNVFVHLFRADIELLRAKNDTAEPKDVVKNQGAIAYLKRLSKELVPWGDENAPTYDGGYTT